MQLTNVEKLRSSPLERIRNELGRRMLGGLVAVRGRRPIAPTVVEGLTRIVGSRNALSDWFLSLPEQSAAQTDLRVGVDLGGAPNGQWAMSSDALAVIDQAVRRLRPRVVLEFGSGHSTVVLAAAMADLHGTVGPANVFSIDESAEWLEATLQLLADAGVGDRVKLAHRPLRELAVGDCRSVSYALDDSFLTEFLEAQPDFVVIDGPSGGGLARFPTLPLVSHLLARPCTFFLDDALRTDEVRVAAVWRERHGARLRRVHLRGRGLLEGYLP